ncbi:MULTISPECIES: AbrB/MazE/SpoVT family DNA-binding domain-containing protein [Pseudomonas]|uniref:AbrB/MazE/SpoVT family DNA-binding domain-containing protein n=1 Tax=Pseudomonas quercus TaxID=2722792 RepID=A0ABX0YLK3_9PSED|nr:MULTISPECIES: AbrB/MazE/SpoVT family DNA-binding domain-containing protein [Pseudomonas]MBF7144273.1 AbrB/MazE/SpoVT family DNA-binding domain-containing protein [Pseudomonas sp. LY10J]NJP02813.1 AbrB/MazE/SpoVT family DNA-binding domain-containing protein [Pseudomonas quercus]
MTTATLTSEEQATIPARIRASLGPGAGDRIESVEPERGKFAIKPSNHPVQALKGMIRKPTKPVSIDDINATIAAQGVAAVSGER